MKTPVAVLISGSGTNLAALIEACSQPAFPARIALVVSNRPKAFGLERARQAGIPTAVLSHRAYDTREEYDQALVDVIRDHDASWVCLAGFMRIVSPVFLGAFPNRVLNIHPSLLPAFPGLNAQAQALNYGCRITGATVHLVDAGMDTGPIIAQEAVEIREGDDLESVKARILEVEHRLYPHALRTLIDRA